jgi:dihydroflavonol-4-reductase
MADGGTDLVTGATGFLGSHIVRALRRRGRSVRAMVRPLTDASFLEALGVQVVPGDATDPDGFGAAAHGAERLFHCAGFVSFADKDRDRLERVNVGGVRNAVEAARAGGVRVLVLTSSVAAVGGGLTKEPVDERQPWHGDETLGYAATKHAGERLALEANSSSLKCVAVNPSIVLGPHDARRSTGGEYLALAALGGIRLCVDMLQGFVDARDAAEGHVLAAEKGRGGERYILSADSVPMADFIAMCRAQTGREGRPFAVPRWVLPPAAAVLDWWGGMTGSPFLLTRERARLAQRQAAFSSRKAREELGWSPRPLAETVRDAVAWLEDAGILRATAGLAEPAPR